MTRIFGIVAGLAVAAALPLPAIAADPVPTKPGFCVRTSIQQVTTRLENTPGSGSAIVYANSITGVSYTQIARLDHAKVGDKVELCLMSVPKNCPAGDDRGKIYAAVDLRTQAFWRLPDSEHSCGGA